MEKIKKYLKALFWPIVFVIGQFSIIVIFTLIYNHSLGFEDKTLEVYITSQEYINNLAQYLVNQKLIMAIISFVVFMPLFAFVYRQFNVKPNKISFQKIVMIFIIGFLLSIFLNVIYFYLSLILDISSLYDKQIIVNNLIINLIAMGILGPILEEYVFRGILYNKLKIFNSVLLAMIITNIFFAFIHTNLINIINALIIGFIMLVLYEYSKNLKVSILFHAAFNISSLIAANFIIDNHWFINLVLLFISSIVIVIIVNKYKINSLLNNKKEL